MYAQTPHEFHIPVMGTGFTIDSPLRIARFGLSSVVSLVDDTLIEQVRRYHSKDLGVTFEPIPADTEDARAKRITAYLDFMQDQIDRQMETLAKEPFSKDSDLTKYFRLLPDGEIKRRYQEMLQTSDASTKERLQEELRIELVAGSIDVNIMTKLDRFPYKDGQPLPSEYSEALSALRGFAMSHCKGAVVLSAGFNPRLYGYMDHFDGFYPDDTGALRKQIILKVSDFRSAQIQGRFFAKRGLWVSEFRIESGLNCGGHAFATPGVLLGPVLQEFKDKREDLKNSLWRQCRKALAARENAVVPDDAPPQRITAQGGIGTASEHRFLMDTYDLDGTGWGTPFLLVPEVTAVDDEHIRKLCDATRDDVYMSESSPLGIPFWTLRSSESEIATAKRASEGRPGSPCPKHHLACNTEFEGEPLCTASKAYLDIRLPLLEQEDMPAEKREAIRKRLLGKTCICHELGGGILRKYDINRNIAPAICPGPGILAFKKTATLEEMADHIYGRQSLIEESTRQPMLLEEMEIYINYFEKMIRQGEEQNETTLTEFGANLLEGIDYCQKRASDIAGDCADEFISKTQEFRKRVQDLANMPSGT